MKDAIIGKLHSILDPQPFGSEATTVYLLVQVRKYLEQDEALASRLPTLLFYCDWVVHHQLERKAAQTFLKTVYPLLEWRDGKTPNAHSALDKVMTLSVFRSELQDFFANTMLPSTLCSEDAHWLAFLGFYANVVKDCKLIVKPNTVPKDPKVMGWLPFAVQSIAIEPIEHGSPLSPERPFPMKWTVEYRHRDSVDIIAKGELLMSSSGVYARGFSM